MRKLAVSAVLALAALGLAAPAGAATHPSYPLGHKAHCRAHYHSVVRRHKVHGELVPYRLCVYRPPIVKVTATAPTTTLPVTAPTPVISYKTSLDPDFTQSGANPLDVTYTYSANAIETQGATQLDLAQEGALPGGILDLYSNGSLECSLNVGGSTDSGTCETTYSAFGEQTVITEYIPTGATAVTETDTEDIEPQQLAPVTVTEPEWQPVTLQLQYWNNCILPGCNPTEVYLSSPVPIENGVPSTPSVGTETLTDANGDVWTGSSGKWAPYEMALTPVQAATIGLTNPDGATTNETSIPVDYAFSGYSTSYTITLPDGDYYTETDVYLAISGEITTVYFGAANS